MLNYTSKIQHFLNLHRKHTKYIVVLLLLSAFVASFVCSALTEPAVSMTDQSFDITTNLSVNNDGTTQDGLPVIDVHYSDGQFDRYMDTEAPLGIATRYGLFGFTSVEIGSACNTNLATPNATIGAAFGSSQIAEKGGQEITLITDSLSIGDITSNNTVLLFPENVNFVDEQGNFVSVNPLPRVKINNGETKHINQGGTKMYAYHVKKDVFINWTQEKNSFINNQNDWINKNNNENNYEAYVTEWYDQNTENKTISKIQIDDAEEYFLNIPYNKLPNGSRELNITLGKNVTLIINVDLSGVNGTYDANFQIKGSQGGLNFTNESSALENGMNLLWSFYDSNSDNKQYTGTVNMTQPGVGCIVAPSADVNIGASFAGTIVANNIKTSATFSKSMFKTVVIAEETDIAIMAHKQWTDGNDNYANDSVTVQLYKSDSPNASLNDFTDADKVGSEQTLNKNNNWNYTWFGLERNCYYYVKEISTGSYYCDTQYENNGRNTTGTVTVKNTVKSIDQNQKMRLTVKLYWSDNAALHPETEVELSDGTKHNLKRKWVDVYRTTEPKALSDLKQHEEDGNGNVTNWNDQFQELTGFFIYEEGEYQNDGYGQSWQYTTQELPVADENNKLYYYYVVFNYNSEGTYMFEYSNNGVSGKSDTITVGCIKMLQLTVNKTWENESNKNEVIYKVYQSRTKADYKPSDAKEITEIKNQNNSSSLSFNLNSGNSWTETIGRSPQLPQSTIYGEKYYYYVEEMDIANDNLGNYNISYQNNAFNDDATVTITNQKKAADRFSIKVVKNKPYALKAGSSAVLYRRTDENDEWSEVTRQNLNEANNWQCVFTSLETKVNDKTYYYKVVEEDSSPGFYVTYSPQIINTSDITQNVQKQVDIYYNKKTVSLKIQKQWQGISKDLMEHVVVNVYRYKGDINAQAIGNYLSSNSDFTFLNNYNVLDDSSNPTINGNTATYTGLTFTTSSPYEVRIDLSQFSEKTLNKIEVVFSENARSNTDFILSNLLSFECGQGDNPTLRIDPNDVRNAAPNWATDGKITLNKTKTIVSGDSFVIPAKNSMSNYSLTSLTFTFNETVEGNNGGSTGSGTGGTTDDEDDTESDDEPTIETSGNTVTYRNLPFVNMGYSNHPWNVYIDLRDYSSRTLVSATVTLTDSARSNAMLLFGTLGSDNKMPQSVVGYGNFNQNSTATISNINVQVDTNCLVITAGEDSNQPSYRVESVVLTFEENTGNSGISFPTGTWNDTMTELTFDADISYNDDNGQYSDNNSKYNFVYKLPSDAYGKQITKIEYTFNDDQYIQYGSYRILCGTQDKLKDPPNAVLVKIIDGSIPSEQGLSYNNGTVTYVVSGDTYYNQNGNNDRLGALSSSEDSYLVFATRDTNNAPTFQITNLKITFASTADHGSKDWGFDAGYAGQHVWIDDTKFHSKEVSYVEMYLKNQITQFPDWKVYDIWLGDYDNPIGTRSQDNDQKDSYWVAKWNYTNATGVSKIGARTINYTDVQKVVITYTDSSTYTINNSNAQSSTSDYVTYEYYFENNNQLTMTQNSYYTLYIPENFKDKPVQKIEAYYENLSTFNPDDRSNFENSILNMWFKGKDGYDFYNNNFETRSIDGNTVIKDCSTASAEDRKGVNEIVIKTGDHAQNLKYVKVTFENGSITINNKRYDEGGFATGSGNQGGNTEILEYSETINVLSTNLNADGNLDYSKSLSWQIPDQFRGFTVKEIKAEFHNRNILTREGTEYYNTVFNMNIYAINDKQLYENWENNINGQDVSEYQSSFNDPWINKRYLPKNFNNEEKYSYNELDFLLICTAYSPNLKQIVIKFEGGHTITLINGNAGENITEQIEYNPYEIIHVGKITLSQSNEWNAIISNQPMVADDGSPYFYVIEEVEIKYRDGTVLSGAISISNLFEVESTGLNALELEQNPENNILTVKNTLKTTNTTMPSTGGIGTHPYRNAGILMMICSGGIYISLRALRKKQN